MRRQFIKLAMAFAAALAASAAPALAQTKIVLNNDGSSLSIKGQAMQIWKDEIEARLGDDVTVELHHAGSLFDQKSQIQGVQLGMVQIIAPAIGIYTSNAPNISVLSLPYLLETPTQVQAAIEDPIVAAAFEGDLESRNIKLLDVWPNGPKDFFYKGDRPILVPEDMRGFKFRVQAVPADLETMRVLGANGISMTWTKVPTALQQGVIDAIEPSANAVVSAGMVETIDQMTRVGYQYSFFVVGVNKGWWDTMPEDQRAAISEALDVATDWITQNAKEANAEAYALMAEKGVVIHDITPEQRQLWIDAVAPVWESYGVNLAGEKVMNRLKEIAATVE
ncbi:TRAP transporter substrate-binding protein [Tropicimonas sp. IMCC34043]|uniref:TRAP transporter substrate-binding protein n=1 Tax=Tropicimonas sp. IMCC34043 TaxID=2248760 RepID=UPI000E21D69A|nr:TRAP transporter substrate-binding protein [Tropicimonas sp. IMCC34043]